MIYLLDVNLLVALGLTEHSLHPRVARWFKTTDSPVFATCAISELGFVRVISQTPIYGLTLDDAKEQLQQLKADLRITWEFLNDDQSVLQLPPWVRTGKQTTDGHLLQLAEAYGATLATLDARIPCAFVIP